MDIEKIKQNYANLDDSKIIQIAQDEIASLHPDVVMILVDEIRERGLNPKLFQAIQAQLVPLTEADISQLLSRLTSLPCPDCGERSSPLIGKWIRKVQSFIVVTSSKNTPMIGCRNCTQKRWKNGLILTALVGWWGFPLGLIRTPYVLITGFKGKKKQADQSDEILTRFVVANRGELITNFEDEKHLVDFVRFKNGFN